MNFPSSGVCNNAPAYFPSTALRTDLIPYYLFLISYSQVHTYTHTDPKAAYAYR